MLSKHHSSCPLSSGLPEESEQPPWGSGGDHSCPIYPTETTTKLPSATSLRKHPSIWHVCSKKGVKLPDTNMGMQLVGDGTQLNKSIALLVEVMKPLMIPSFVQLFIIINNKIQLKRMLPLSYNSRLFLAFRRKSILQKRSATCGNRTHLLQHVNRLLDKVYHSGISAAI